MAWRVRARMSFTKIASCGCVATPRSDACGRLRTSLTNWHNALMLGALHYEVDTRGPTLLGFGEDSRPERACRFSELRLVDTVRE
jgi:hypothetical protein